MKKLKTFATKHGRKLAAVAVLCGMASQALAFLPVPQLVTDPLVRLSIGILTSVTGKDVAANVATLSQAITIANVSLDQYRRISYAARRGWVGVLEQIPGVDYTVNRVGETLGWPDMMKGKVGIAASVWQRSTIAINPNPEVWSEHVPGMSAHLAQLATVEAIDGSSARCLDQIAQARSNSEANRGAMLGLDSGIADDSDSFNGTVGQLNINNAAVAQANAERRVQTAIQSCLSEATILNNKVSRDQIAAAMNAQQAAMQQQSTGSTTWDGGTTFSVPIP